MHTGRGAEPGHRTHSTSTREFPAPPRPRSCQGSRHAGVCGEEPLRWGVSCFAAGVENSVASTLLYSSWCPRVLLPAFLHSTHLYARPTAQLRGQEPGAIGPHPSPASLPLQRHHSQPWAGPHTALGPAPGLMAHARHQHHVLLPEGRFPYKVISRYPRGRLSADPGSVQSSPRAAASSGAGSMRVQFPVGLAGRGCLEHRGPGGTDMSGR